MQTIFTSRKKWIFLSALVCLQFTSPALAAADLAEALDAPGITWTTVGTPAWFSQALVSHDGVDAAQSGAIADGASTTIQATLVGPGTLSFWWKVSSETSADYLKFFLNGVQQTRISGEVDWQFLTYELPAGSQTAKWTYAKNAGLAAGQDRAWVDEVQFTGTTNGTCTFTLSPTSRSHGYAGASNSIGIVTAAGCTWNVSNTNSWVSILSSTNGTGNGTVTYTVAANSNLNARGGNVLIADQLFAITQSGAPACPFTLSPTGRQHNSASATDTVDVVTSGGCTWTVSNTNTWVTVLSSTNGTGNGTVIYSVAGNSSGVSRSGNLLIAGQLFAVAQSATLDGCIITLSPYVRSHGYGAASNTVTVTTTAGCAWNVSNTNAWLTLLSPTNGTGNGTISYTVAANLTPNVRGGNVLIGDQLFAISQSGAPTNCTFTLSPTARAHDFGASTGTVDVTTSGGCVWTVSNTNTWVTIPNVTNVGSGPITYSVTANPGTNFRSGTLLIAGQPFSITQTGAPAVCTYTLSSSNASHSSASSTGLVSVTAAGGCSWNVINTNAWINIAAGASGTNNGLVRYTVVENPTAYTRSGNLLIAGQLFTVTQAGTPGACAYDLSPESRTHGYGVANNAVSLITAPGCPWIVVNTNSWLSILSPTNGSGAATINYTVAANPSTNDRSGNVLIGGQLFALAQHGTPPPCIFALSSGSNSCNSGSATGLVGVTATTGCSWSVINSNTWISIVSGSSGNSNGTVRYVVTVNPSASARSGNMLVAGQPFVVNQIGSALTRIHVTAPQPGGPAWLSVEGRAGATNVVESSADLLHWVPIRTNSTSNPFTDGTGTNAPRRFYRTYELP